MGREIHSTKWSLDVGLQRVSSRPDFCNKAGTVSQKHPRFSRKKEIGWCYKVKKQRRVHEDESRLQFKSCYVIFCVSLSGCSSAWIRALGSGPRGHWFESSHPDFFIDEPECKFIIVNLNKPLNYLRLLD